MPSIGKDLVKIRKYLELSLQDIQFATKLPQHTLEKIEDDTIFTDAEEGPIYTRNFVRSYGRVLKIDDDLMIDALNLQKEDKYDHQLLQAYPALKETVSFDTEKNTGKNSDEETPKDQTVEESESDTSISKNEKDSPDKITPESSTRKEQRKPSDSDNSANNNKVKAVSKTGIAKTSKTTASAGKRSTDVDWADMGRKMHQKKKQLPVWVIGLIILIIILGFAGYFGYQSGMMNTESTPQQDITTPANDPDDTSLSIELDEPQPQEATESQVSPEPVVLLNDTLGITVYAAFGNVDPIRVWSDTKPRFDPYWIEEGSAMVFDFVDSVRVRGPYDNMLIFLNGHLIDNFVDTFYNDENNYLELNRSDFTSDDKWSEDIDLQLPAGVDPPQEIRSRPIFN